MSSHFEQLEFYIPELSKLSILDVGSGRGKFLVSAARKGAKAFGVEVHKPYIEISQAKAKEFGVDINVKEGVGEALPFQDDSFDFVNLSEVVEHVEDPVKVMKEVWRVLKPGGRVYVSVPNRFGMKDQHFHLWGLNWMPRAWAESYISFRKKHKDYSLGNGRQRISEMHYYTYGILRGMLTSLGFQTTDMRMMKLKRLGIVSYLIQPFYVLVRTLGFDSFHILAQKS